MATKELVQVSVQGTPQFLTLTIETPKHGQLVKNLQVETKRVVVMVGERVVFDSTGPEGTL